MIISIDEFFNLRSALPVVDVRSEGEFEMGHIQKAINIPILKNAERAEVGIDYKQKGQAEAIKTGFRLVEPRLSQILAEAEKTALNKEMIVHCWRGGMRSEKFCQFANAAGIKTHQLTGGYKAYRHVALEFFKKPFQLVIIGGCTGSGKSEILRELKKQGEQIIDLEKLANHKGSAFGGLMQPPQPTSEQFQNNLFEEILQVDLSKRIWVEDESISVGSVFIPNDFWKAMGASPVVEIELERPKRVERLVNEYGNSNKEEFLQSMERIVTRLGGQNFKAAKEKLLVGDMASTIEILLTYYDKAYNNGLEKKKNRIQVKKEWDGKNMTAFAETLKTAVISSERSKQEIPRL